MFSEEFIPLTPVNFFQLSIGSPSLPEKGGFPYLNKKNYLKYLLPNTSELCGEESFAEVALGWNRDGIEVYIRVDSPFVKSVYPQVDRGDSVEIFIDTRDVKTSGFNTKFCHHFFFFAEGVEGVFAGEITHFRTEDAHPLCDPVDLKVKTSNHKTSYDLNVFIPREVLHGYDPEQFTRLGFSYRINRLGGMPQHFSVVTNDYHIDQQPSLWSSLELT